MSEFQSNINIAPKIQCNDLADFNEQKMYQSVKSKVCCQSSFKLQQAPKSTRKLEIMILGRQKSMQVARQMPLDKVVRVYDELQKTKKVYSKQFLNSKSEKVESSQLCQVKPFASVQVVEKPIVYKRVVKRQQSTMNSQQQLIKTLKTEPLKLGLKQSLRGPHQEKINIRQQNVKLRKQNEKLKLELRQFQKIKDLHEDMILEKDYLQLKCKHYQEDLQSYKLLVSWLSYKDTENSNNNITHKVISKALKQSQSLCTDQSILTQLNNSGQEVNSKDQTTLSFSHKEKQKKPKVGRLPLKDYQIQGSPTDITFQKQCSVRKKSDDISSIQNICFKDQDFEILELSGWDEIIIESQVLFGIQFFKW